MTGRPSVEMEDVRLAYEGMEMRFDLRVAPGERVAVIGPSGAGKSTLLDLVAGFAAPSGGRITMEGRDMTGVPPSERPVSFVFQENNLFAHLSALRNVALGLSPRLRPTRDERRRAAAALADVGLEGFETRMPAAMSGGERQRVALARAFVRKRPVLLLDEPFAALGPALRREMLSLLQKLHAQSAEQALTILMVTHNPQDALGFADRVIFLEGGAIRADGTPEAMLSGNSHTLVNAYLGRDQSVLRDDAIQTDSLPNAR